MRDSGPAERHSRGAAPAGSTDRGVSEFTGVAILVLVTVVATASVGLSVLLVDTSVGGPPEASFDFQYIDGSSVLVVTFQTGEPIAAGNLTLRGRGAETTWAALAGTEPSTMVGPASPRSTVQLSSRNAFGEQVSADSSIRVVYTPSVGNETVLQRWEGQ